MELKHLIAVMLFVSVCLCLACSSGPSILPTTDLEVRQGDCGPEFVGTAATTTDLAIGDSGWRWEQSTTTENRVYKPCDPPESEPESEPGGK